MVYLVAVSLVIVGGIGVTMAWWIWKYLQITAATRNQWDKVRQFEKHLSAITNCAIKHYHSVGADTARGLYDARRILDSVQGVLRTVEHLGRQKNRNSLVVAEKLLEKIYLTPEEIEFYHGRSKKTGGLNLQYWDRKVENLIATLDEKIEAMTENHWHRPRQLQQFTQRALLMPYPAH